MTEPKYIVICRTVSEAKRLLNKTATLLSGYSNHIHIDRKNNVLTNERASVRFVSVRQSLNQGFRGKMTSQDLFENAISRYRRKANDEQR